jgi:hypothetical protein
MSLQYVVYDYWEYGYAEGDAILEFGSASVNGLASVSASPSAIWAGNASIAAVTAFTATGQIIGDEWVDTVPGANTWTQVSESNDTWTPVGAGSNVWFSNSLFDPYVEIDYWVDGYTDDRYDYWIKTSSVQDNWVRQ